MQTSFFHFFSSSYAASIQTLKYFLPVIAITIIALNSGCGDIPVDPEPGRRDYVWTLDTLNFPENTYGIALEVWGNSAKDVWLVGKTNNNTIMWHFDGSFWTSEFIGADIYPLKLYGLSGSNIWLAGTGNDIWNYDGSRWSLNNTIIPPYGFETMIFFDIRGNSPEDIFAVGSADAPASGNHKGVILHYENGYWKFMDIPEIKIRFSQIVRQQSTGKYFLAGFSYEGDQAVNKIYAYNGKNSVSEIYSGYSLAEMNGEVYFVGSQKIYKYIHQKLVLWKNFTNTDYSFGMIGRSENDFFCKDKYFNVLHYNGSDFENVYKTKIFLAREAVFDNEVFFVYEGGNNRIIVLHGVLK